MCARCGPLHAVRARSQQLARRARLRSQQQAAAHWHPRPQLPAMKAACGSTAEYSLDARVCDTDGRTVLHRLRRSRRTVRCSARTHGRRVLDAVVAGRGRAEEKQHRQRGGQQQPHARICLMVLPRNSARRRHLVRTAQCNVRPLCLRALMRLCYSVYTHNLSSLFSQQFHYYITARPTLLQLRL